MAGDASALSQAEGEIDPAVESAKVIDSNQIMAENGGPVELDPETGLPKVLRRYAVLTDPPMWVIPQFLSDSEVDHLVELAEGNWVPSEVGRGSYKTNDETKDLSNKISPIRTSYSSLLKTGQTTVVKSVEMRLAQIADMDVENLEPLNMVRYAPGQFFKQHHDGRFRPKTVFIYLNDLPEEDAGETFFPRLGVKFTPRRGCAVMWNNTSSFQQEDHRLLHQGLPPKTAIKYGVNCFFNDKSMRNLDVDCGDDRGPWNTIDPTSLGEEGDSQNDGALMSYQVLEEPELYVTPNALQADELNALVMKVDGLVPEDKKEEVSNVLPKVQAKMAAVADMQEQDLKAMRLSKCSAHELPFDGREVPAGVNPELPWRCVYVFLNAVEEGGQLRFPRLTLEIVPRVGSAVLLLHPGGGSETMAIRKLLEHRGRSPCDGHRYVAMCCFQSAASAN